MCSYREYYGDGLIVASGGGGGVQSESWLSCYQIETPFKPEVGDATDVSNFDTDFTSEDPTLTPPDDSKYTLNLTTEQPNNHLSDQ